MTENAEMFSVSVCNVCVGGRSEFSGAHGAAVCRPVTVGGSNRPVWPQHREEHARIRGVWCTKSTHTSVRAEDRTHTVQEVRLFLLSVVFKCIIIYFNKNAWSYFSFVVYNIETDIMLYLSNLNVSLFSTFKFEIHKMKV